MFCDRYFESFAVSKRRGEGRVERFIEDKLCHREKELW